MKILTFENTAKVGYKCTVRWTNNYLCLSGQGTITKVNARSVLVQLTAPVTAELSGKPVTWPAGQVIKVPLPGTRLNCIEELPLCATVGHARAPLDNQCIHCGCKL